MCHAPPISGPAKQAGCAFVVAVAKFVLQTLMEARCKKVLWRSVGKGFGGKFLRNVSVLAVSGSDYCWVMSVADGVGVAHADKIYSRK